MGIVDTITPRSVRRILDQVDLQPHRTRYWKTSHLDARFKQRAEKVLWCYEHAEPLARDGIWVVCADEVPNLQVLERRPIRRAIPGHMEQQEFEYRRHGTVNLLFFLIVHSGDMELAYLPIKDASHYVAALQRFRRRHRNLRAIYLIHDNDGSHTAETTQSYLASHRAWWKPRFTPAHASWLNQAELLIGAFSSRYLKRSSWTSPEQLLDHAHCAAAEYNRLYAHPFQWSWSRPKMRQWYARHAG